MARPYAWGLDGLGEMDWEKSSDPHFNNLDEHVIEQLDQNGYHSHDEEAVMEGVLALLAQRSF